MRQALASVFLLYIRWAAKLQLKKINPRHVVGITGSAGKSSCREAVSAILSTKYRVKQSAGLNSETGLPLDILGFSGEFDYSAWFWVKTALLIPLILLAPPPKYDIYVAELGIDSPDEPRNMTYLLKIVQPDVGVFLNVFPVHTAYFPQKTEIELISAIAAEKGKLITALPKNGFAILNLADKNVSEFKNQTKAQVLEIKPYIPSSNNYSYTKDYGVTFGAALAVAKALGIEESVAKTALETNFQLPAGRGVIFKGINDTTIIDSSYNASRQTMLASLDYLKSYPGKRKIAVLGDMRELGDLAKKEHETVAKQALKDADHIFTFGPLMEKYFPENDNKIEKFTQMSKLIDAVQKYLQPRDIILVKGSQNTIFLETLVEALLENKEDTKKLCRRGKYWDMKRGELL